MTVEIEILVSKFYFRAILLTFQKVLTENDKNAIVSPFFVKVLLSVLVEASGPETINHREIASAIASFAIIHDIHERYSQAYASISVGFGIQILDSMI